MTMPVLIPPSSAVVSALMSCVPVMVMAAAGGAIEQSGSSRSSDEIHPALRMGYHSCSAPAYSRKPGVLVLFFVRAVYAKA